MPLNPQVNTGTKTATIGGNIGIFINGVALFDYRDDVSWNTATNSLFGGPENPHCPGALLLLCHGIEMHFCPKNPDLIVLKRIRQWEITTTTKIPRHLN